MTHDPREALEQAAADFESIREILISCLNEPERSAFWKAVSARDRCREALTASPGEQEPCGWQFCCPDGKWIGCDEPPANELRDEPEKFRRVYLSPPPAAGWDRAAEIVRLIDDLRSGEGDSVTILCDNPDFNGQPNCAVICNADWTGWQDRRFAADTILDALCMASTEKQLPSARPVIAESNGHHWVQRFNLTCCRDCGIVRRADDSNSPCNGVVGVSLRREAPAPEGVDRPDAGGGVRVKPLEWEHTTEGSMRSIDSSQEQLEVWAYGDIGYWRRLGERYGCKVTGGIDAAKAAAQADYERRILSALSTRPAAVERDCEVCGGDCASANPPVAYCPVKERKQRKEAVNKAREMLKLGINIQTTGNATNVIVTGIVRSLLDCIDDLEADLKCAIAVGRMAARPAAAESNASVDARLREALKLLISDIEDYERVNNLAPSPGKNDCWQSVTRAKEALSAVGDEAKKSEGGSRKQPFDPADAAGVKSGTVTFDGQTGRPNRDEVGASQTPGSSMSFAADKPIAAEQALRPSDPTAERREIVARSMVLHDPNYTIYHMPGETPRKWKATSGAILYTSELSEDHAEKVRKRADAILAALDGGAGE